MSFEVYIESEKVGIFPPSILNCVTARFHISVIRSSIKEFYTPVTIIAANSGRNFV